MTTVHCFSGIGFIGTHTIRLAFHLHAVVVAWSVSELATFLALCNDRFRTHSRPGSLPSRPEGGGR